ncbi:MAG TPA: ABC transporter permease, partial [Flavisolibacter sp.]|nr:ABC transporter permease [Flavisolibacter sp.]
MIRNYLKSALRNLGKNKGYTALNILGLGIGIAACVLIFVVLRYETSFDNFHPKRANIYRIATEFHDQDGISYSSGSAFPVAPALRIDFPQIKEVTATYKMSDVQVTIDNGAAGQQKKFKETGIYFVEPNFFSVFNFPWLSGDARTLRQPNSVVLTQEMAEKYFGDWKSAIGKTVTQDNKTSFRVTGILKN